ncbi:MAG TPA: PAS domain-containing protein [Dyadobacter sp.]|nr:PAS domain-containing protein [Dyadobacter sp.]
MNNDTMHDNFRRDSEGFELVARATHDVIWDWDLVNNTLWWNEVMEVLFGYSPVEHGPESWYSRIHPDDRERVVNGIHEVINSGGSHWTDDYRFRYADGTYAHIHDRGYTIHENGKAVRMVGAMQDVTKELLHKRALEESEQRLNFALQSAQLGTWNLNLETNLVEWDKRTSELFGVPNQTCSSYENILTRIHPEDRVKVEQSVSQALKKESGGSYNIQFRTIAADGVTLRWLHCKGQAYFTGDAPYRFSGIAQDITDLIANQERAFYADQQAMMTIEGTGAGSFLVDMATNEIVYSSTLCKIITGEVSDALSRKIFIEHLHPDDITIRNEAYTRATQTGELDYEARFVWKDGTIHWAKVLGRYLYDKSNKAVSLSGILLDITDRVEAEQKVRESEELYRRLADELELRVIQRTNELNLANQELTNSNNNLQQFAYAASHDMQEPLRKIQSFSSRLQSMYSDQLDEDGTYMLFRMQDAANRMSLMIDDLLAYSRLSSTDDSEFVAVDLNKVVRQIISDLEIGIAEQKAVIRVDTIPPVSGSPSQLVQLMQNLISNAVKYKIPDQHPEITITGHIADPGDLAGIPYLLKDVTYVAISVMDNGIGFDVKHLDRIFQMFQRLHGKGEYSGSGIGLALCKKVVQNHHGYITAHSNPGEGAHFLIYLPMAK